MRHLPILADDPACGTPCRASRQCPPRASGQHRRTPRRHQPQPSAAFPLLGSRLGAAQTLPLQQRASRRARDPMEHAWAAAEPINRIGSPPTRSPGERPHAWQATAMRPSADMHRARHTAAPGGSRLPLGLRAQALQRPPPEPINLDRSPPPRSPVRPAPSAEVPWGGSEPVMQQQRRSEAQADTSLTAGRQWTPTRPAHSRSVPTAGPTAARRQQTPAGAAPTAGSRAAAAGRLQPAGGSLSSHGAAARSPPLEQIPAEGTLHDQSPAGPLVLIHHSPHLQPPPVLHQTPQHGRRSDALPGDRRHAIPQQQFHVGLRPAAQLSPQPPQRGTPPGGGSAGPQALGSDMWPRTLFHLSDRAAPCPEAQVQSGPKRPAPDSSSSERSSSDLLAEAGVKRARASLAPPSQAAGECCAASREFTGVLFGSVRSSSDLLAEAPSQGKPQPHQLCTRWSDWHVRHRRSAEQYNCAALAHLVGGATCAVSATRAVWRSCANRTQGSTSSKQRSFIAAVVGLCSQLEI